MSWSEKPFGRPAMTASVCFSAFVARSSKIERMSGLPTPSDLGGLQEVARHDGVDGVVTVPADGQGELELLLLDLAGIKARLRGQHVIERGHVEASAGAERDAEILRVAVGGAKHPEQDAGAQEGGDIPLWRIAAL